MQKQMWGRMAVVVAVAGLLGCSKPTAPDDLVADTFTGTVGTGATIVHPFAVSNIGQLSARVSATTPADSVIGLGVGTSTSNGGCQLLTAQPTAFTGTNLVGTAVKGSYCVTVYDSGLVTTPVAYTVIVVHP